MVFPEWFLSTIVYLSIAFTAVGVGTLFWLLLRDRKTRQLW